MWNPSQNEVSSKEIVGRRAFGKKLYSESGERGHFRVFRISIFLDDRYDKDLSFDRLGVRRVFADVISFLSPIGLEHGLKLVPKRDFRGWATIKMVDLKNLVVKPSSPPSAGGNPYHADLIRDGYRDKGTAETLAWRLSVHASKMALTEPDESGRPIKKATVFINWIMSWIGR